MRPLAVLCLGVAVLLCPSAAAPTGDGSVASGLEARKAVAGLPPDEQVGGDQTLRFATAVPGTSLRLQARWFLASLAKDIVERALAEACREMRHEPWPLDVPTSDVAFPTVNGWHVHLHLSPVGQLTWQEAQIAIETMLSYVHFDARLAGKFFARLLRTTTGVEMGYIELTDQEDVGGGGRRMAKRHIPGVDEGWHEPQVHRNGVISRPDMTPRRIPAGDGLDVRDAVLDNVQGPVRKPSIKPQKVHVKVGGIEPLRVRDQTGPDHENVRRDESQAEGEASARRRYSRSADPVSARAQGELTERMPEKVNGGIVHTPTDGLGPLARREPEKAGGIVHVAVPELDSSRNGPREATKPTGVVHFAAAGIGSLKRGEEAPHRVEEREAGNGFVHTAVPSLGPPRKERREAEKVNNGIVHVATSGLGSLRQREAERVNNGIVHVATTGLGPLERREADRSNNGIVHVATSGIGSLARREAEKVNNGIVHVATTGLGPLERREADRSSNGIVHVPTTGIGALERREAEKVDNGIVHVHTSDIGPLRRRNTGNTYNGPINVPLPILTPPIRAKRVEEQPGDARPVGVTSGYEQHAWPDMPPDANADPRVLAEPGTHRERGFLARDVTSSNAWRDDQGVNYVKKNPSITTSTTATPMFTAVSTNTATFNATLADNVTINSTRTKHSYEGSRLGEDIRVKHPMLHIAVVDLGTPRQAKRNVSIFQNEPSEYVHRPVTSLGTPHFDRRGANASLGGQPEVSVVDSTHDGSGHPKTVATGVSDPEETATTSHDDSATLLKKVGGIGPIRKDRREVGTNTSKSSLYHPVSAINETLEAMARNDSKPVTFQSLKVLTKATDIGYLRKTRSDGTEGESTDGLPAPAEALPSAATVLEHVSEEKPEATAKLAHATTVDAARQTGVEVDDHVSGPDRVSSLRRSDEAGLETNDKRSAQDVNSAAAAHALYSRQLKGTGAAVGWDGELVLNVPGRRFRLSLVYNLSILAFNVLTGAIDASISRIEHEQFPLSQVVPMGRQYLWHDPMVPHSYAGLWVFRPGPGEAAPGITWDDAEHILEYLREVTDLFIAVRGLTIGEFIAQVIPADGTERVLAFVSGRDL